jgi:propanediol utilization protein
MGVEEGVERVLIPVGVSNRHAHLCREHLDQLFGKGFELTKERDLYQCGQFAAEQTVTISGPKGAIERVRILGPLRKRTQVEVSRTDAYHLGLDCPVGDSGPLPPGQAAVLIGPQGSVTLHQDVVVARRHIHVNPKIAAALGVRHGDTVFVAPVEPKGADPAQLRTVIFGNVLIRVDETFRLQMHIDVDEANAAGLKTGDMVYIVKSSLRYNFNLDGRRVITENDVRQAILRGQKIRLEPGMIVTPAARDLGKQHEVFV